MAVTRAENQITWNTGSNSATVTAGSDASSDDFVLDATCVRAQIHLKASVATPASDDQLYVWLQQSGGDPDGTGADEYDSQSAPHAKLLGILDTNVDNPAGITVPLPLPQKTSFLYAEGVTAGTTNTITVSATITEQRVA